MKILFLYFGQPRMIEECIPWHDELIQNIINTKNYQIDLEYHLWNEYFKRLWWRADDPVSYTENYLKADTQSLKQIIHSNRVEDCNISSQFYNYDIVESLYKKINERFDLTNSDLDKTIFYNYFSQIILKAIAAKTISNDYDVVVLLRTDIVFNRDNHFKFIKFLSSLALEIKKTKFEQEVNLKNVPNNIKMYVPWLKHVNTLGTFIDDNFLYTTPNALKIFYNNHEEKILSFIEHMLHVNETFKYKSGHYYAASFANYYRDKKEEDKIVTEEKWELCKQFYTLARPTEDTKQYISKVGPSSFLEINKIYERLKKKSKWK